MRSDNYTGLRCMLAARLRKPTNRNSKEIILGVERTYEKQCQYEDKKKIAKYIYIFIVNIRL